MGETKKKMKLSLALLGFAAAIPQLDQQEASEFLRRAGRARNKGGFEEVKKGNLERECIEEECSAHELFEVYDDESHPGIKKYNDCKEAIEEVLSFCNEYGIDVPHSKEKSWLRICTTKSQEEMQQMIKQKLGAKWNDFMSDLTGKVEDFFDQFRG